MFSYLSDTWAIVTLIAAVIVFVIICRYINNHLYLNTGSDALKHYSWIQILWPFNDEPYKIYKHLSPENKGQFWSIAGTVIIGILTCWLGFTVQKMVYNASQSDANKLAHMQLVDKYLPAYNEYVDSNSYGLLDSLYYALMLDPSLSENGRGRKYLTDYVHRETNWSNIARSAEYFAYLMGELRPYFSSSEKQAKIGTNVAKIITGTFIFDQLYNDSTSFRLDKSHDNILRLFTSGKMTKYTGVINKNATLIAQTADSIIKIMNETEHNNKVEGMALLLSEFMIVPTLQNINDLNEEIAPKEEESIIWYACGILLLALFIGYYIFRIFLMKILSRKELEPNPCLSQDDYEKLKIHIKRLQYDLRICEAFEASQKNKILDQNAEIDDQKRVISRQRNEIDDLKKKLADLMSNNNNQ